MGFLVNFLKHKQMVKTGKIQEIKLPQNLTEKLTLFLCALKMLPSLTLGYPYFCRQDILQE